ncbi:MAG: precorrin-2 C(20)-methyltransferase [Myxococcaceae bacterium]|nr:precorrin-2 C(20)-methyltransferase [Myxococcaceae bacterium]
MGKGMLYGVGVGPGDPELMTVKAVNTLNKVRVVGFFAKRGKLGNAHATAKQQIHPEAELLPLIYPYTVELSPRHPEYIAAMRAFYDESAAEVSKRLDAGRDVAVLCEGDPMFYGSYMYLHDRLAERYRACVIPGITSFAGCAAGAGIALVSTDRVFSIVPGTLPEHELEQRLASADAVAIIKLGSNFGKVRRVLERLGKLEGATYFEHGTTEREVVLPLALKTDERSLYFSLIIVPGHDGGPYRQRKSGDDGELA